MGFVLVITGSPSATSRTAAIAQHVGQRLAGRGLEVKLLSIRDLDPVDLLHARTDSKELQEAFALVARANAVVVLTPVYKAAYTGVLKAFLDLLPQFGLAGKSILPLATGGTLAHVLAVDYALRPVLASLGATHIHQGLFLLDKTLELANGLLNIDAEVARRLHALVDEFADLLDGGVTQERGQKAATLLA